MLIYHTHRFGVYIASASVSCCPEERQLPVPGGAPQGLCTAQSQTGFVRPHTDARSVTTPEPHLRRSPSLAPESATHGAGPADEQPHDPSPVPAHAWPGPQHASPVGSPGQQQVVGSQERNCCASAEATSAATTTKQKRIGKYSCASFFRSLKTSHAFASFVVCLNHVAAALIVNAITNF